MDKKKLSFFSWVWFGITILTGVAALFVAVYPNSLKWLGINLSEESIVFGSRVFLFAVVWFIFGHNLATQPVADIKKAGPVALIAFAIVVGLIIEGGKMVAILRDGGFGFLDLGLLVGSIAIIIVILIWGGRQLKKLPKTSK